MGDPIRSILIAGGGLDGWFVALSLARRLPGVALSLVEVDGARPCPADLYAGARPGFRRVLEKLRIDEWALAAEAGGVVRLGQRLTGWSAARPSFVHAFGEYGTRVGQVPFHQGWLRALRDRQAPDLDLHSMAAVLARANRMALPSKDEYSPLSTFEFGWNFDPTKLRDAFRSAAMRDGVERLTSAALHVQVEDGRVAALALDGGRTVTADLFVDCTGPEARLLSALAPGDREDWRRWLAADRIAWRERPVEAAPPLLDEAALGEAGWRLTAALRDRTVELFVAAGDAGGASDAIPLPQGRRRRFWVENCVALGDAAVTLEPLGAPGLHMLALEVDRMLSFLPGRDCDPAETGEYNRRVSEEVDLVRNFVILHHALAGEAGKAPAIEAPLPDALAHTLSLFRARGKIPGREGESASLSDWLAVLLGHGIMPDMLDPFLDELSPVAFAGTSAAVRTLIAQTAAQSQTHAEFLRAPR